MNGKCSEFSLIRESRSPAASRLKVCCCVRPGAAARKCADGSSSVNGKRVRGGFAANLGGTTEELSSLSSLVLG